LKPKNISSNTVCFKNGTNYSWFFDLSRHLFWKRLHQTLPL